MYGFGDVCGVQGLGPQREHDVVDQGWEVDVDVLVLVLVVEPDEVDSRDGVADLLPPGGGVWGPVCL